MLYNEVLPSNINIIRQITTCSDSSAIFEVDLDGQKFRCELNAYKKLLASGVCARGFVPNFYGYIDQMGSCSISSCFTIFRPRQVKAKSNILLEYLPNAESLNSGVHHQDIYPKNLLLVRGNPNRLVWIDFDVATTFTDLGPKQLAHGDYEIALIKGFVEALRDDQAEGLPPDTKFYQGLHRLLLYISDNISVGAEFQERAVLV
ncbi:hypothetical protein BDV25DRAFT_132726 [Aspergillus avenaceus]|uniref:Aminoglycoside phosphotransferase domain-containing protein n=1 Tax=Aspergillus avenaceus TaxID=36643 RepID=A0A5N6TK20_ASPAV|nr:hypothetical protein BDV25DRAFT_132726 [Aspergillus avenaceus]